MNPATTVLSTERVVSGIRRGLLMAPLMPAEAVIDRHVEQVRRQRLALRSNDPASTRLLQLVSAQLMWLKPEIREALGRTEIYCLDLPLSVAYCDRVDDRALIVLGQGLIDLIAYRVCCSHFEAMFPEAMATYPLSGYRTDLSALEMLSNALMLLGCQFYTTASPLPDVCTQLSQASREDCERAISGALLYVLLHELGHLQLGHLERNEIRALSVPQAVPESLSVFQQQEYEADRFATNALIDVAQVLAALWQGSALNFYQQLELITGQRSDSHPLAINRRLDAAVRQVEVGGAHGIAIDTVHINTLAERFLDTEAAVRERPNALIATPREACLRIFRELVTAAYTSHGVDLRACLRRHWQPWRPASVAERN